MNHLIKIYFLAFFVIFGLSNFSRADQAPPLIRAIYNSDLAAIKVLLQHGADVFAAKNDGSTALDFAFWSKNQEIRSLVLNHRNKYGNTPLIKAICDKNHHLMINLLERGADPTRTKLDGTTPLQFATWSNNPQILDSFKKYFDKHLTKIHLAPRVYLHGLVPQGNPEECKTIRIVHISDSHNFHAKHFIPEGDILIHSGDFTDNGTLPEAESFVKFMEGLPHKHKLVVLGNHEFGWDEKPADEVKALLGQQLLWLHDKSVTIEGINFFGSSWNGMSKPHAFALPKDEFELVWKQIPMATDILITHVPPYGVLDKSHVPGQHWGGKGLMDQIVQLTIPIHLFGHTHDQSGFHLQNGTLFSNGGLHSINKDKNGNTAYGKAVVIDVVLPRKVCVPSTAICD